MSTSHDRINTEAIDVLQNISQAIADMRRSEAKVSKYIISNPAEVAVMTISELAEASDVSESTVSRLCRRLKLRGFQDLKVRISLSLGYQLNGGPQGGVASFNSDSHSIVDKYLSLVGDALGKLQASMSPKSLEKASTAIRDCGSLVFYGVGGSGIAASVGKYLFFRLGVKCDAFIDVHAQLMSAALLKDGDVAIGISQSGSTAEVLAAMKRANESGATTICITGHENSPISKCSEIRLTYSYGGEPVYSVKDIALLDQICTLQILSAAVSSAGIDSTYEAMRRTSEAVVGRFL